MNTYFYRRKLTTHIREYIYIKFFFASVGLKRDQCLNLKKKLTLKIQRSLSGFVHLSGVERESEREREYTFDSCWMIL